MRALSLIQPWAWLVIHGGKDIENRRWNTKLRGQFLIHAAKGMREADYDTALDTALAVGGLALAGRLPAPEQLDRGGIVGVAELYDVVPPEADIPESFRRNERWHFPEQFGFRLRNVRSLPFTPCKGALGFWNVPDAILETLLERT